MKMPLFRSTAAAAIAALLTGDFALLGIAFNDDGKAVILTPPLVSGAQRGSRPPTALRRMAKLSTCHWLNAQQFCRARPVRAPKGEHWRSAWPSASKNGAATGTVREKIALPLTFHTQWLVKGSRFRNKPYYLIALRALIWSRR